MAIISLFKEYPILAQNWQAVIEMYRSSHPGNCSDFLSLCWLDKNTENYILSNLDRDSRTYDQLLDLFYFPITAKEILEAHMLKVALCLRMYKKKDKRLADVASIKLRT